MADLSQIKLPNDTTVYKFKDSDARDSIQQLQQDKIDASEIASVQETMSFLNIT